MAYILADLFVRDVQKSLAYYRDVLGFEVKGEWTPEGQPTSWGWVALGECQVMFNSLPSAYEGAYAKDVGFQKQLELNRWGVGVTLYFRDAVPDVDAYFQRVRQAGAVVLGAPETRPYGWYQFLIEDLDGYRLAFSVDAKPAA
jgi:catechol 2,3-dioxygenase-like lactoylglutathione lyase family enzyme